MTFNLTWRDKSKKLYTLLEEETWGPGCSCALCRSERAAKSFERIVQKIWTGKIPEGTNYYAGGGRKEQIWYLCKMEDGNAMKKKKNDGKDYVECSYCGSAEPIETLKKLSNGRFYCKECQRHVWECEECGRVSLANNRNTLTIKGKRRVICYECVHKYSYCSFCGQYEHKKDNTFIELRQGKRQPMSICPACFEKEKCSCKRCGEHTLKRYLMSMNNQTMCQACIEEESGLMDHMFQPTRLHFASDLREGKTPTTTFHMGFELEVSAHRSSIDRKIMAHLVKERVGRKEIYCVHDGSIAEYCGVDGIEIVSHPFTWQCYKTLKIDQLNDLLMFLREKGYKADFQGIGFHVHTTKAAWGSHQIYKLLKLIYSNKAFVTKIAERAPNKYCFMNQEDFDKAVYVAKNKKNRNANHYSTINLNTNDGQSSAPTIEFRMFQGTLEPLRFHKNLEFVYACYHYTKNYSDMGKYPFLRYIKANQKMYPALNEFITWKVIR